MNRLVAIAAIGVATLGSPRAEACWCGPPTAGLEVSPSGTDVPTNATIMLWVPERFSREGTPSFAVRVARAAKGSPAIAVTSRRITSAETEVIELVPARPLAAATTYEVVVSQHGKPMLTRTFTTGHAKTSTAPAWGPRDVLEARYVRPGRWGAGSCIRADANLELTWLGDDPQRRTRRIAVWIGKQVDLTKPPTTYVNGLDGIALLGNPSTCASATLAIPSERKLVVAVKLFDVAGNAGAARQLVVDTTRAVVRP